MAASSGDAGCSAESTAQQLEMTALPGQTCVMSESELQAVGSAVLCSLCGVGACAVPLDANLGMDLRALGARHEEQRQQTAINEM